MKKKWTIDNYMSMIVPVVLVCIFAFVFYILYADGHPKWVEKENMYIDGMIPQVGNMLMSRLSGEKVQVVGFIGERAGIGKMRYIKIQCRVVSGRVYRDSSGLLSESKDSYIQEYSIVCFRPYELQWIDKAKQKETSYAKTY